MLSFIFILTALKTDEIAENILDVADRFLLTDQEHLEKSNVANDTSATFLRNLDKLAIYLTSQSTVPEKVCGKQNIALTIQKKSNSFTLIVKDKNNKLDTESVDGEITDQLSLAKVFVSQSLLTKAGSNEVSSFVFRSGL